MVTPVRKPAPVVEVELPEQATAGTVVTDLSTVSGSTVRRWKLVRSESIHGVSDRGDLSAFNVDANTGLVTWVPGDASAAPRPSEFQLQFEGYSITQQVAAESLFAEDLQRSGMESLAVDDALGRRQMVRVHVVRSTPNDVPAIAPTEVPLPIETTAWPFTAWQALDAISGIPPASLHTAAQWLVPMAWLPSGQSGRSLASVGTVEPVASLELPVDVHVEDAHVLAVEVAPLAMVDTPETVPAAVPESLTEPSSGGAPASASATHSAASQSEIVIETASAGDLVRGLRKGVGWALIAVAAIGLLAAGRLLRERRREMALGSVQDEADDDTAESFAPQSAAAQQQAVESPDQRLIGLTLPPPRSLRAEMTGLMAVSRHFTFTQKARVERRQQGRQFRMAAISTGVAALIVAAHSLLGIQIAFDQENLIVIGCLCVAAAMTVRTLMAIRRTTARIRQPGPLSDNYLQAGGNEGYSAGSL